MIKRDEASLGKDVEVDVGENNYVTGALLNRCADPVKGDLDLTIMLLKGRSAAAGVLDRSGLNQVGTKAVNPDHGFHNDFRLTCEELDAMVLDLRAKEQLSPRLESQIQTLRIQFGALTHYFLRLTEIEEGDIGSSIALLEEMRTGGKYPMRVFPNITLVRVLMSKTKEAGQAQSLYDYVVNDKFVDAKDGKEKTVCKPDDRFFELWFGVCREPAHFEVLYKAMLANGFTENIKFITARWRQCCQSVEEIECFARNVVNTGAIWPTHAFFKNWLNVIVSPSQLVALIESLIKSKLLPDRKLIMSVLDRARGMHSEGGSVMVQINEFYADADHGDFVSNPTMLELHERLSEIFSL